jgi:NHLM bacteriocin system ABC transporter peptidase/ATP-binding protein
MEAVECGAAALGMVLGYYKRFVALEELRLVCGVSRDGSKASNIVSAAEKYGLDAKGFRCEPAELRTFRLPFIVFWNFNHFVVVDGFGRGRVYLNDPAVGKREVSEQEFDEAFTGVALTFEPGPGFEPGGERPNLVTAIRRRLVGYHEPLAFIILCGLALVIPGLVIPAFSRVFVDQYLVQGLEGWVFPLLLGMVLTGLLRAAIIWMQRTYLLRLDAKMALTTSSQFFWHVLRLPVEFFQQRYGGEIGSRVALNDRVAQALSGELPTTALNLFLIVFYAVLMARYDPLLTLIGVIIATANLVGLRYAARRRADSAQRVQQEHGKLLGTMMSGLQIIETIKATSSESDFFARWAGYQAKLINAEQQAGRVGQMVTILPRALDALNTTAILVLGGLSVIEGRMTMGELVAFQSLMASFMAPVNQLVDQGGELQELLGDLQRLDDVYRHPIDPQVGRVGTSGQFADVGKKFLGKVEIRNLTFGYNRLEPPLIENFNLTIQPGRRVALVGGSGSGKSTIAKLVAGLYDPWAGEVAFDGVPRVEIPRHVLNNSLGMVDQEIFLFEDTVRENLALWDPTIPEANLVQAARDAAIHEDILAKPNGYDYLVQEGGRNFSGGQRQRLEIARVLANNPTIIILDEATSALDPYTEQIIDDNLRKRGCTCLIIAHRLSTIRDCDEIVVLQRGQVMQRGTHESLIADPDGLYAHLIHAETPGPKKTLRYVF